tara:strand:+ start:434 stop:619 length:186 start_codon:yes stop_codon:yes gene_type:complete
MNKTYRVILSEDESGKVTVEKVDESVTGNFPNKANRVKWKSKDKRFFTNNFLNTVDEFTTK